MAIDYGLTVDKEGFNVSMEEARQKARNARNKVIFTFLLSVKVNLRVSCAICYPIILALCVSIFADKIFQYL